MEQEDINRLRELNAAATPGTLIACGWGDGSTPDGMTNIFNEDAEILLMECIAEQDAALIVAATNAFPALIAQAERVKVLEERLELTGEFKDGPDGIECRDETIKLLDDRITTLEAENARLREEIGVAAERECSSWCAPEVSEHTRYCRRFTALNNKDAQP